MKKLWDKWYYRTICYVALLIIVLISLGYAFMEKLLFPAPFTGKKAGNITLQSGKAVLDAVWFPTERKQNVILYSHGNGEHLALIIPWLKEFSRHDYSIFAYDYAGYGASIGKPGEKQAYQDIESAYRYLTQEKKISPDNIIVMGFSVGSGPSTYLATKYPVKGLVLVAPFASAIQVGLPFSLPFDRFPSAKRLKQKGIPVLIFHGTADRIIPFRNGQSIFEHATGRKKFIPVSNADHNNIFSVAGQMFWDELKKFSL